MMTLIIGGSGSGKSAYAEDYLVSGSGKGRKYYIATMQVWDAEGRKKIERHRGLRSGKGFATLEQPRDIEKAVQRMEAGERSALLECISNLAANEMFAGEIPETEEAVVRKLVRGIRELKQEVDELVVVSNNVFEDGTEYEETTMAYIRAVGSVNEKLAAMADEVIEVVAGIPLTIKSGRI